MSKRLLQRAVGFFVICAVIVSTAAFPVSAQRDFQAEIDALENKIAAANDKKAASEQSAAEIKEQISLLQEQMSVYNDKIAELNSQIAEKMLSLHSIKVKLTAFRRKLTRQPLSSRNWKRKSAVHMTPLVRACAPHIWRGRPQHLKFC